MKRNNRYIALLLFSMVVLQGNFCAIAQVSDSDRVFIMAPPYKLMSDSEWATASVREKILYSVEHGEAYMQLCGYRPRAENRDPRKYIYSNTRQLHFLGEWTYSRRQVNLFNQYPDSVAWLLREALFEQGKDLYYWHNVIHAMDPDGETGRALLDYYQHTGAVNSIPLTLLANWMRLDSFPEYMASSFPAKFREQDGRLPHSVTNKQKLGVLAEKFIREYGRGISPSDIAEQRLVDSLYKADTLFNNTGRLSDECFYRLSPKALLAYCRYKPEKYFQICALQPGYNPSDNIYSDEPLGSISLISYSERQVKALLAHRAEINKILLQYFQDNLFSDRLDYEAIYLICNTIELIPHIVRHTRLGVLPNRSSLTLLCQFLFQNNYQPFRDFWKTQVNTVSYGGTTSIPRTESNIEQVLTYATLFANEKNGTNEK